MKSRKIFILFLLFSISPFYSSAQFLQHPDLVIFSLEDMWPAEKLKRKVRSCEQTRIIYLPYKLKYDIVMKDTCCNRATWDEQGRLLTSDFGFPTYMWKKELEQPLVYEYHERDGFTTINAENGEVGYTLIYSGGQNNQISFWHSVDEMEIDMEYPEDFRDGKLYYEGFYRHEYEYKRKGRMTDRLMYISHGEYYSKLHFSIAQGEYYDKKGRITKHTYDKKYRGSQGIPDKSYTYDRRGNITSITVKNNPYGDYIINYTRDKKGNILTMTTVDNGGNVKDERKYKYSFDMHGNWTLRKEWKGETLVVKTHRKIQYYD